MNVLTVVVICCSAEAWEAWSILCLYLLSVCSNYYKPCLKQYKMTPETKVNTR
jgi:hypothetical protein